MANVMFILWRLSYKEQKIEEEKMNNILNSKKGGDEIILKVPKDMAEYALKLILESGKTNVRLVLT